MRFTARNLGQIAGLKVAPLVIALCTALAGCKQSISESDAIYFAYCTGIYPYAEVAIQRGFLRYPGGTFQGVQVAAERAFPPPARWGEEMLRIFRREMGRAQNHGGAIQRGDVQQSDLRRLNGCIEWASKL